MQQFPKRDLIRWRESLSTALRSEYEEYLKNLCKLVKLTKVCPNHQKLLVAQCRKQTLGRHCIIQHNGDNYGDSVPILCPHTKPQLTLIRTTTNIYCKLRMICYHLLDDDDAGNYPDCICTSEIRFFIWNQRPLNLPKVWQCSYFSTEPLDVPPPRLSPLLITVSSLSSPSHLSSIHHGKEVQVLPSPFPLCHLVSCSPHLHPLPRGGFLLSFYLVPPN